MSLEESDLIPCNEVHALVATILPKKENESVAQARIAVAVRKECVNWKGLEDRLDYNYNFPA